MADWEKLHQRVGAVLQDFIAKDASVVDDLSLIEAVRTSLKSDDSDLELDDETVASFTVMLQTYLYSSRLLSLREASSVNNSLLSPQLVAAFPALERLKLDHRGLIAQRRTKVTEMIDIPLR